MSNYYRSHRMLGATDAGSSPTRDAILAAHEAAHAADPSGVTAQRAVDAARARVRAYEAAHPVKTVLAKGAIVALPVLAVYGLWKLFT